MADSFVGVARDDEVEERLLTRVEVEGRPVILTRVNGRLCALDGICTHELAELADGEVEDDTVWCPLHGSGFNVFTGEATSPPAEEPLPVYAVRVVDGEVQVSHTPREA